MKVVALCKNEGKAWKYTPTPYRLSDQGLNFVQIKQHFIKHSLTKRSDLAEESI